MSLFKREAPREVRQAFPEPIISPFPGTSVYGGAMSSPSAETALQVSAVWACTRLLSDVISGMAPKAFTLNGDVRVPVDTPSLLKQPSADGTVVDWLYQMVMSMMLRGNAYGHIVTRDSMGFPTQIEWWHPDRVDPGLNDAGQLEFLVNGVKYQRPEVFHVRAYPMPGLRVGLSPIQYAASQISTERYVQDFALGFFRDGAHPSAILESDDDMTQDQAHSTKERFMAAIKGREPGVLSGGLKYIPIQVSPEESQFLATQKYGVASIARIFGVPPEMIAGEAGNSMTYANVEQRSIDFLTYSVQPWLSRIEAALSTLLPGKKHVKFDTTQLLRTDLKTRMEATAIAIASHQLLPDEARAMGDLPPFTDEEKKLAGLVPMTVSPSGRPTALPGSPPAGMDAVDAPDQTTPQGSTP
jgi:HK97 family phage portal protein